MSCLPPEWASLLFTHLTHQTPRLLLLTQKGRKVLKPTEWNHRGRKPRKKTNKSQTNIKFIETKSDRKPPRRRRQTFPFLDGVLQLCESVATFPQLLNHLHQTLPASIKMVGKCKRLHGWKSIIHSPLQGRAGSGEMNQSERAGGRARAGVRVSTWRCELSRLP